MDFEEILAPQGHFSRMANEVESVGSEPTEKSRGELLNRYFDEYREALKPANNSRSTAAPLDREQSVPYDDHIHHSAVARMQVAEEEIREIFSIFRRVLKDPFAPFPKSKDQPDRLFYVHWLTVAHEFDGPVNDDKYARVVDQLRRNAVRWKMAATPLRSANFNGSMIACR